MSNLDKQGVPYELEDIQTRVAAAAKQRLREGPDSGPSEFYNDQVGSHK